MISPGGARGRAKSLQENIMFQSTVAPIRRLTPRPTDRGRADCPSLKGGGTEKDFIGFAVLSTTRFPLKGEVSNHKGIYDETLARGNMASDPKERGKAETFPLSFGSLAIRAAAPPEYAAMPRTRR